MVSRLGRPRTDLPEKFAPAHALPENNASRRSFLFGAGGLLALGLTACGSGRSNSANSPGDTRTVEHKYGTTEISGRPSRIVTVGLTEQDYVLALGAAPVGVREWFGDHRGALWQWAQRALGDNPLPEVLPVSGLNFERIATLDADLILGVNSGLTRQEYDMLSRLAPTVAQPREHADYGAPWQDITRIIGHALGEDERADILVSEVEARFEQARAQHPEFVGATGLLATAIGSAVYVYAEGPAPSFLTQLGFQLPPKAGELFTGRNRKPVELAAERLDALEADVLFMGLYGAGAEEVTRRTLYRRLDVSREGRDLLLPKMSEINGALSFGTVLSLPFALDTVVPRLAALLDGDPASKAEPIH